MLEDTPDADARFCLANGTGVFGENIKYGCITTRIVFIEL
jgi:hypothetical protein